MTKPNPYSVFREPPDYYAWDKYLEQLALIELSGSQREAADRAIRFLRSLFGETFLKRCFYSRHPFYYQISNSAPVARLRLTGFADTLRLLQNAEGFDSITARLKKTKEPDKFLEALTVVKTAIGFQKNGLTIIFEPAINTVTNTGIKKPKNPDFKVIDPKTAEEVFVEVSRLEASKEQVSSRDCFNTVWRIIHRIMDSSLVIKKNHEKNELIHHHLLPYAKILAHLEETELTEIIPKIVELARKVCETNKFQELIIKNKIEVAISPTHDHSKAKEWAKSRSQKNLVESLPIPLHETHRARVKIGRKIRQLPRHTPGIIVIPTDQTLLFFAYDINQIIAEVKSELEQYPQLIGVVLSVQIGESPKMPIKESIGEHLFVKKSREDWTTESFIVLENPAFNLPMPRSTIKKIIRIIVNN